MRLAACRTIAVMGVVAAFGAMISVGLSTLPHTQGLALPAPLTVELPMEIEPSPLVFGFTVPKPEPLAIAIPANPAIVPVAEPEAVVVPVSRPEAQGNSMKVAPRGKGDLSTPDLDETFTVNLTVDPAYWKQCDAAERQRQLADAVAVAVLSASSVKGESLRASLADALAAEPDSPRSVLLPGPELWLIAGKEIAQDDLAAAADDARLESRNRISASVFTWESSADGTAARVTRKRVPANRLFSSEYGYYEADVESPQQAETFAQLVSHVTWTNGVFRLGGRPGDRRPKHWMSVQDAFKTAHVAALERKREKALKEWNEAVSLSAPSQTASQQASSDDPASLLRPRGKYASDPISNWYLDWNASSPAFQKRLNEVSAEIRNDFGSGDLSAEIHERTEELKRLLEVRAEALRKLD